MKVDESSINHNAVRIIGGMVEKYAHKNPTRWTKTGRHFDIASILEDMRND